MAENLPVLPSSLKSLQHYLKTAVEHDKRDPVVAYYCRLYAFQRGMELDKKSVEGRSFLMALMDSMEKMKQTLGDCDAITSEVVGQAHVENYALKLFLYADTEDRAARFGKNVVKSFYTAGMLFDILAQFGELAEDLEQNKKYAKWKAAYLHNCMKSGETPHAGPLDDASEEFGEGAECSVPQPGSYPSPNQPTASQPDPSQPSVQPSGYQPSGYQPSGYQPSGYQPSGHQPSGYQPSGYQPSASVPAAGPTPASQPPSSQPAAQGWQPPAQPGGVTLNAQDYQRAMKLCKYASSALQYQDSPTAIDNLTKALNLLCAGKE